MTAQRVFHAGNDFEIRVKDGKIFLTGYGWSGPESLSAEDAVFAAAAISEARHFLANVGAL